MTVQPLHLNLVAGWSGVVLGFFSGMVMGLFFHRDGWLGGYGSFKRRMYRLAHISFFGLGAVNLLFWLTMKTLHCDDSLVIVVSWAFIMGAISMPLCCVIMAHFPKAHLIFSVPVISLLLGGVLMLTLLLRQPTGPSSAALGLVATQPALASDDGLRITDSQNLSSNALQFDTHSLTPF